MSKTREQYEKMLLKSSGVMEKYFGVRLLTTFQCILCGTIIDNVDIAISHIDCCPKKNEKN